MPEIIISDTSCLIILSKINQLELLHSLYGKINTTYEIAEEYGDSLPEWITTTVLKDKNRQLLLELQIDKGEASAVALALENPNSTIILDDYKARKIAGQLGISYTGTIGVIIKAKLAGIIPSIKPLLDKIKNTDFYISEELETAALKEAGEGAPR